MTAGCGPPLLGVTDGNPALIAAFEHVFPESLRQRCAVLLARNTLEKVSKPDQEEVKGDYWAILNNIDAPPGERAVSIAHERAQAFAEKWRGRYPRAVDCVLDNLSALTAHLHFPVEHREGIRHSNLLERTFGGSRRWVKVIGRLPGEHSCLSLVCWASGAFICRRDAELSPGRNQAQLISGAVWPSGDLTRSR